MKISSRGRYGLRFMIDLAVNAENRPVSVKEISERQDISVKYLENIIVQLVRAGLVKSARGATGGYMLADTSDKISVGAVLRAVEGSLSPVECVGNEGECPKISECYTAELWKRIKEAVESVVDSTTLADLIKGKEALAENPKGC
ncbi:MAG: RrF2 family transcriptional regulator [Oscillospiraceae bacterium]|nr:RrF2 family transcriptional regulator [Oscillospiraceae bacterium]